MVSAQGFEPRTHALEGRCSIQLSYAPTLYFWSGKRDSNSRLSPWQGDALPLNYSRKYNGGNNRTRTCDPLINSQLLYQLSHIPIISINISKSISGVLYLTIIFLGLLSPISSSDLPTGGCEQHPFSPILVLLQVGFTRLC